MKLGSLFDGSGGFPLAGDLCGITPIWASEIEPFPIAVTRKRFPGMIHFGDVSQINGAEIPPVDIITFGSPCQDMSLAGKRAGLEGSKSGLFFEAIRIIQEMRGATNGVYPRYIVWENVFGAFSSNKGEDFRKVLQEICGIAKPEILIPRSDKWQSAGSIMGERYSVAWRTFDAKYWGVPQRRRRIYLVADFGGERAGEILFEREGMRGHTAARGETQEGFAKDAAGSIGGNRYGWDGKTNRLMPYSASVYAHDHQVRMPIGAFLSGMSCRTRSIGYGEMISPTLTCTPPCTVYPNLRYAFHTNDAQEESVPLGCVAIDCRNIRASTISYTLQSSTGLNSQNPIGVWDSRVDRKELNCATLMDDSENRATDYTARIVTSKFKSHKFILRKLTPVECARLQGFPDWWCDGIDVADPSDDDIAFWTDVMETHRCITSDAKNPKTRKQIVKWLRAPHSDSAEYKMWGNGIALPCAMRVMQGIAGLLYP